MVAVVTKIAALTRVYTVYCAGPGVRVPLTPERRFLVLLLAFRRSFHIRPIWRAGPCCFTFPFSIARDPAPNLARGVCPPPLLTPSRLHLAGGVSALPVLSPSTRLFTTNLRNDLIERFSRPPIFHPRQLGSLGFRSVRLALLIPNRTGPEMRFRLGIW